MPSNIDDVYRRLTALLLKGPRDPRGEESAVYRLSVEILNRFGYSPRDNPIVGVALEVEDDGEKAVYVFLTQDIENFSQFLTERLSLQAFRIRQLTTGRILPNGRPTVGGESLGEGLSSGRSGTFGCLVEDAAGSPFLLSCHHVLSAINAGNKGCDLVWQPSSKDGGRTSARIGVLHDFSTIKLGGINPNEIDAALAKPDNPSDVKAGLKTLGSIHGTASNLP